MGLFSFIKSAGEKPFGMSEAKAAEPPVLQQEVTKHGLGSGGLTVTVDGDKGKVSGQAATTEEAEKISSPSGTRPAWPRSRASST
jgi:hypothetical protein